jgi:hypothetical protein
MIEKVEEACLECQSGSFINLKPLGNTQVGVNVLGTHKAIAVQLTG